MHLNLFPFFEYWVHYLGFTTLVLVLLIADLGFFHRKSHSISLREASVWCGIWFALAMIFSCVLYYFAASEFATNPRLRAISGWDPNSMAARVSLEYLSGYVVEVALSLDNLFVFVIVFRYFSVPMQFQHRVLFFGILGALLFRAAFIATGAAVIHQQLVTIGLGVFLIFTGMKLVFTSDNRVEPDKNLVIRLFRLHVPLTRTFHGSRFWVRVNGVPHATPLMVTLLFLEMTDVMFAIDSVPAIFAVTREPLIVFTSNIFAILGLRSLYFLLAGAGEKFHFLKHGLSVVLVFVGLKMAWLNQLYEGQFPVGLSLAIVLGVVLTSILLSLMVPRKSARVALNAAEPKHSWKDGPASLQPTRSIPDTSQVSGGLLDLADEPLTACRERQFVPPKKKCCE